MLFTLFFIIILDMSQRKCSIPKPICLCLDVILAFILDFTLNAILMTVVELSPCTTVPWIYAFLDTVVLIIHLCIACEDLSCNFLHPRSFSLVSSICFASCIFSHESMECAHSNKGIAIYNFVLMFLSLIPDCIQY